MIYQVYDYNSSFDSDPQRLDYVQERLASIKRLQRIHKSTLPELLNLKETLADSFYNNNLEKELNNLLLKEEQARKQRDLDNQALTIARQKIAKELEAQLMKYLIPMGLENVLFKIKFESREPCEQGADSVEFLFSANPGNDLAPLSHVASGGEMSRFLLAFKATISETYESVTFVFDEIDSGVSGRISSAIGSVLKDLSKFQQVFCVTHQPLVAAAADHHFSVNKTVKKAETISTVKNLQNLKERQKALAELAGGEIGEASNYAASLLDHHAA